LPSSPAIHAYYIDTIAATTGQKMIREAWDIPQALAP
jgi:hypothetical protein